MARIAHEQQGQFEFFRRQLHQFAIQLDAAIDRVDIIGRALKGGFLDRQGNRAAGQRLDARPRRAGGAGRVDG